MDIIIYTLSCPITNQIRYVGQTSKTIEFRLKRHLTEKGNCRRINWFKSLKNKNLLPIIEIIDVVDSNDDWRFWEQYYISLFKSWNFNLVNMTDGGDGIIGFKHSEATKLEFSKKRKGRKLTKEWRENIIKNKADTSGEKNGMYGKKHSDEHKKRVSEKLIGRTFSDESLLKLRKSNGTKIFCETNNKEYFSMNHVTEELGIGWAELKKLLNSNKSSKRGYKFKYIK